jgi:hypothetical protein
MKIKIGNLMYLGTNGVAREVEKAAIVGGWHHLNPCERLQDTRIFVNHSMEPGYSGDQHVSLDWFPVKEGEGRTFTPPNPPMSIIIAQGFKGGRRVRDRDKVIVKTSYYIREPFTRAPAERQAQSEYLVIDIAETLKGVDTSGHYSFARHPYSLREWAIFRREATEIETLEREGFTTDMRQRLGGFVRSVEATGNGEGIYFTSGSGPADEGADYWRADQFALSLKASDMLLRTAYSMMDSAGYGQHAGSAGLHLMEHYKLPLYEFFKRMSSWMEGGTPMNPSLCFPEGTEWAATS